MKTLFKALIVLLPWILKRPLLIHFFGYQLCKTSRIGLSWIYPHELQLDQHANIGHFCVAIHLNKIHLGAHSTISRNNWITGYPANGKKHFSHIQNRTPELTIGKHSAITKNHHIDCTDHISIGNFTTIAGYQSQFLTHSINLEKSIQDASPISIGDYCFIGTNVVVLGGSELPDYCVLGAKSLLTSKIESNYQLVGGVPAKAIKTLPKSNLYF